MKTIEVITLKNILTIVSIFGPLLAMKFIIHRLMRHETFLKHLMVG